MSKKTENAEFAKKWLSLIENNENWSRMIKKSFDRTQVYQDTLLSEADRSYCRNMSNKVESKITITQDKTYDVIKELWINGESFVCVLNFASFFNPGGGFTKGAFTQEESLCAVSGLYPILTQLDVYEQRADKKVPPEYSDEIIYSPSVPFTVSTRELAEPYLVDVISCAAPNCNRIVMTQQRQYMDALNKRIEAIYLRPYINGCDTIVLGAWGCGVFKNDPGLISNLFTAVMAKYPGLYRNVIFACGSKENTEIFKNNIRVS